MAARGRSPRRLDRFARRSPLHAAGVTLLRIVLPIGFALAVGYGLIAASPLIGELMAEMFSSSTR